MPFVSVKWIVQSLVSVSLVFGTASTWAGTPVANLKPVAGAEAAPAPLTFREWKAAKIYRSQSRLRQLQSQYRDLRQKAPRSPRLPLLHQELSQEQWNLEVAQDLTTRDYLYLYVKGADVRPRLGEIAARLSPEEVGLFLESYFQLMERSQPASVKRNRLGIQAPSNL